MRVAIPTWENRVSPVLDTASRLLIIEVKNQKEIERFETILDVQDLYGRCVRILNLGLDILICGAISRSYFRRLTATGLHIISGISGHPEDVLEAYLQGTLSHSRFSMPGYRGNHVRSCVEQGTSKEFSNGMSRRRRKGRGRQAKGGDRSYKKNVEGV